MASETFQNLSEQLPPAERKQLLEKIRSSINLEQRDADSIVAVRSPREEMESRLRSEILTLGFWSRLWLRILRFFTGKTETMLYYKRKVEEIKQDTNHQISNIVLWERGVISEKFARRVYDLLYACNDLKPFFNVMFKEEGPMGDLISSLMESRVPNVKLELFDILPKNEMETIYRSTGEKKKLKSKLNQNLDHYLKSIPSNVLVEVRDLISPLYYMKHLVLFPYPLLLDLFGHNPGDMPLHKYPTFRESLLKGVIEFVERLYFALYLCNKAEYNQTFLEQVFLAVDKIDHGILPGEGLKIVKTLLSEAQSVFEDLPFLGILRGFYEDPYYKLQLHMPSFRLRDFYHAHLSLKFNNHLEAFFPRLRSEIIESQKESLFQEQNAVYLENYTHHHELPLAQYGLKSFAHVESMNLLYSFLKNHMPIQITPLIQTIGRVLLQNEKRLLTRIITSTQILEEIKQRIENLDIKIGPLGEEGEIFQQLVTELGEKPASHKLFKSFVGKQDTEARQMLAEAKEKILLLKALLEEIRDTKKPSQRKILGLPFLQGGNQGNLGDALLSRSKTLGDFYLLLKQTVDIESGG
jgi:hypothetical protein